MSSRRAIFALFGAATTVVIGVACSFPDVSFGPGGEGGAGTETSLGDAGLMAVDAAALARDGEVSNEDAGGKVDSAGGCDPLDCDGDGDKNKNFDAGPDGAPPDCDDLDSRAKHSQTKFLTDQPVSPTNGDWNCDGDVVKFYPVNVTCTGFLAGDTCNLVKGFTGDPACGATGDFVYCKKDTILGTSCVQDRIEQNIKQACQ